MSKKKPELASIKSTTAYRVNMTLAAMTGVVLAIVGYVIFQNPQMLPAWGLAAVVAGLMLFFVFLAVFVGRGRVKRDLAAQQRDQVPIDERPTKTCPFCGEDVLAVAVKCRYCSEPLANSSQDAEAQR